MNIQDYLKPLGDPDPGYRPSKIGGVVKPYNGIPVESGLAVALIGVPEDRAGHENKGSAGGPGEIRKALYPLQADTLSVPIVDLGDLVPGEKLSDTYSALTEICRELISQNYVPVILGGSQDLTLAQTHGSVVQGQEFNLAVLDARLDLAPAKTPDHSNFLFELLGHPTRWILNPVLLGYQSYFTEEEAFKFLDKLSFEHLRLGELRQDLHEAEPLLRDAALLSVDMSCVRYADNPGHAQAGPNGLFAHELCHLTRYAGMSMNLRSIGFYEYNPTLDPRGISAQLVAQAVWHFIQGLALRTQDHPEIQNEQFLKYRTLFSDSSQEILFYKSRLTGRWWMQVPLPARSKLNGHQYVSCSYGDYQKAVNQEVPDRYLKAVNRMG